MKDLLKSLEASEEKKEEQITIERTLDPAKKIATIYSKSKKQFDHQKFIRQLDEIVSKCLIIPYFEDIGIKKALVDYASAKFSGKCMDHIAVRNLKDLVLIASKNIYEEKVGMDEPKYLDSLEKSVRKRSSKKEVKITSKDIMDLYLEEDPYVMIAAKATLPLLKATEKRIPYVSKLDEIKDLVLLSTFIGIIENKETLKSIGEKIQDTRYSIGELLLYTIIKINQDYKEDMGKIKSLKKQVYSNFKVKYS